MKRCYRCKRILDKSNYNKCITKKDGMADACRDCTKEMGKIQRSKQDYKIKQRIAALAWYRKNRDKILKKHKERYLVIQEIKRDSRLKAKYGLRKGEYQSMLIGQNLACRICGSRNPGYNRKRFTVDHDHTTGKIRGLLCYKCNTMLGMGNDDVNIFKLAVEYLQAL